MFIMERNTRLVKRKEMTHGHAQQSTNGTIQRIIYLVNSQIFKILFIFYK